MAKGPVLEGVFAINKPYGMSSAQVIRDCQEYFNPSNLFAPLIEREQEARARESKGQQRRRGKAKRDVRVKMGHGGTLDPLATGVLILGVGKGTKSLQNFISCTKTYETVVLFGASTDTYDRVGRIVKKCLYDEVTRPAVEKALESFRGKYKQMPPLFSALKMDGKPIYEYAREGKPLPREIETRDVEVSELELVEWYEPGTHNYRWPTEEAHDSEKYLVNSVWRLAKRQAESDEKPMKLTPEQEEEETQALAEWETAKQKAEERVDNLIKDKKRPTRQRQDAKPAMMSGALGELPLPPRGKGSDLIPPPPAPGTPFPWEDEGPPAAKLRMTVTSGFYVRSLCHDLGEKLDCGGMMAELVRTRQGDFSLGTEQCIEYEDLRKGENVWGPKVEKVLSQWVNKLDRPVEAAAATESMQKKRHLGETDDTNGEEVSSKRARKNSGPPESTPIQPSIEKKPRVEKSPKRVKKSASPEHTPIKPSIEEPEHETKSPKRSKGESEDSPVRRSIEEPDDGTKSPKRSKKESESPKSKSSPVKRSIEEPDETPAPKRTKQSSPPQASPVLPSIEDSSQPHTEGVGAAQVLDSVEAGVEGTVDEADTVKASVEDEQS